MNLKCIFSLFAILHCSLLWAQLELDTETNTDPVVNNTHFEEVILKPGYDFEGEANYKMNAYIDPTIIAPSNYGSLFSSDDFDAYEIDTELAVGYTPGTHGVSPSGAATYTVPVQLPPGTNGMEPELAISYNSQAGNGLLGMGWNLAGLSVITRTNKTHYYDGEVEPIRFDDSDKFSLDGQRLMSLPGTYGNDGTIYGTESENFSRIIPHGTSGSGPEWFEVKTKDGKIIEYGRDDENAVSYGTGEGTIFYWMITKIYDQHGNYIEYKYIKENNQIRLDKILYTGNENASVEPYNKIQLYYQDREDKSHAYTSGHISKSNYLLKKIKVSSYNAQFREYHFNYAENFTSFLTSITEYGASSQDELNETIFEYEDKGTTALAVHEISRAGLPTNTSNDVNIVYYPGDFNGDGVTDFLALRYGFNTNYPFMRRYTDWSIYINNNASSSGFTKHILDFELAPSGLDNFREFDSSSYFPLIGASFKFGDLDGDGIDDIIVTTTSGENNKYNAFFVKYDESGNAFLTPSNVEITRQNHVAQLGDFDGDGIKELFLMNLNDDNFGSIRITSFDDRIEDTHNSNLEPENFPNSHSVPLLPPSITLVDYDGDGSSEVIIEFSIWYNDYTPNSPSVEIFKNFIDLSLIDGIITNFSNNQIQIDSLTWSNMSYSLHPPVTLNFNDDTQHDIAIQLNNNIYVGTSIGGSNFDSSSFYDILLDLNVDSHNRFLRDINGDGKTDIIKVGDESVSIWLAKGYVTGEIEFEHYSRNLNISIDDNSKIDFGDLNGDGNLELIVKNTSWCCINFITLNPKASTKDRRLKRVKNGFGHVTAFTYETLSAREHEASSYPMRTVAGSFPVVSSISTTNAHGDFNVSEYDFYKAQVHLKGKGFLGFEEQRVKDLQTDFTTQSIFEIDTEFYVNLPKSTATYLGTVSEGNKISHTSQIFELEGLGNNRFFTKLLETDSEDLLTGINQSVDLFYDTNGNITLEIKTIGEVSATEVTNTHYSAFDGIDGWHVAPLPGKIEVNTTRNSEPQLSETTEIFYNPNGTVDYKETRSNSTHANSVEEYHYGTNPFGLVESVTISGVKPTGTSVDEYGNMSFSGTEPIAAITTDHYVYSDDGRHILEHTDRFGFTTEYTYYNRWGKPKTVTDHQGRQNFFEYDGFGRIEKEVDYLGQVISTERAFVNNNPVFSGCDSDSDVLYTKTTTLPNNRTAITKYNALGQVRFKQQTGQFDDLYSSVCYDELGREKEKTTPYFNGDANIKTAVVQYDEYGRVSERNLNPIEASMLYEPQIDGHLTTLTSNTSGTRTSKTDLTGRIVQTTDPGGTLTRTYQSGGLLKRVELNGEKVVENTYDEFGRQIKLDDMNAGATHYNYDSFDNLSFQQDARGNILETEYDELGRIEVRTVSQVGENNGDPLGSYDYEYYTEGPEETLLKNETAPSGYATEYTYDDDQNIATITEIIDGQSYTTSFEYDEFGKPTRKEYPSGFAIRYEYDSKQYLKRITSDDGQLIIWEITGGNAQGQVTDYTLGNGLSITKEYDDDFFPKSTTAVNGGNPLFSLEYDFDPVTGNLLSRNLHGTEEHFFYDTDGKHLNRLAGTGPDESTVSETYHFADNGNITSKAGMGPYIYDNDRKNAVSQIDVPQWGQIQDHVQQVNYNHFNSASTIVNLDDELRVDLEYGPDDQRRMAKYWDVSEPEDVLLKTRIYAGAFEKQISADLSEIEVNYISAGGQLVAMYVVEDGVGNYYYPHQDHLGSIIHITDANGDIVYTQSFDAWGRTRNPNDLTYNNIPPSPDWLWRGYTGHEHLDEFGLINMNGRLYDPVVGRMLSPDNYVQSPDFTQSYNRYSYVFNNPLKYYDPDGELAWFVPVIIGAIVGAYIGGSTAEGDFNPGNWAWDGNTFAGMGIGAVIGGAAGYGFYVAAPIVAGTGFFSAFGTSGTVAAYTLTGTVAGGLAGYGAGFAGGMIHSGGDWGYAHQSGMVGSSVGAAIGSVAGAIAGLAAGQTPTPVPRSVIDGEPIEFDPLLADNGGGYYGGYQNSQWENGDGYITSEEAFYNYKFGEGQTLTADINKLDLSRISVSDFPRGVGSLEYFNFAGSYYTNPDQAIVYGNIGLVYIGDNKVFAMHDYYDFDLRLTKGSFKRDFLTIIGNLRNGGGTPFYIYIHGTTTISP